MFCRAALHAFFSMAKPARHLVMQMQFFLCYRPYKESIFKRSLGVSTSYFPSLEADPLAEYSRYYGQADESIQYLIQIR